MQYYRLIGWLASLGGIALALMACGSPSAASVAAQPTTPAAPTLTAMPATEAPTQTAIPPTEAPTRIPTETPEATCAITWMEAYRDGSPDLEAQLQRALAAEKISASVHSSTYGETDGCGGYHAASFDIQVSVQVKSISERADLQALAARIAPIVQQIHKQTQGIPSLGRNQIIFVANSVTCAWDADQQACQQP